MFKKFFSFLFNKIKNLNITKKIILSVSLMIYIFLFCISVIKVDYVILTPGSINNTILSVTVSTENDRGKICTVGIYEYIKPSVLQYWIALNDNEMEVSEYNPETDLDSKADEKYGLISKKVSLINAVIVAYEKAMENDPTIVLSKEYKGIIVSAIFPNSVTDLKVEDVITKVNGKSFSNYDEFIKLVFENENSSSVKFTVIRITNNKEYELEDISAEFSYDEENKKSLGISVFDYWSVDGEKSTPKFTINDNISSLGSSGGAMTALSIYNALTTTDITKVNVNGEDYNLHITGTGTIELDGRVGKVGGVKQKVLTAYVSNADVFFVGEGDYQEALEAMDFYNIDSNKLKLIKVSSLDDIINSLESWGE